MSTPNGSLRWLKPLARAGYASRGVVYTIIGGFAVMAAFGIGAKMDSEGALQKLISQPLGAAMLWIVVVGLVGYVAWRLVQSLLDTDEHGFSPKGLAVRGGLLASAFTYTTLAIYALALLGVFGSPDSGNNEDGSVAQFIGGIIGRGWVNWGLAAVFAGVAIAHWYKAVKGKYADHFVCDEDNMPLIHTVSRIGLIARGSVFAIISGLLAFRANGLDEDGGTPGIEDAFRFVENLPGGQWWLAALGTGIVLFAGYSFLEAIYRRINVEDASAPG